MTVADDQIKAINPFVYKTSPTLGKKYGSRTFDVLIDIKGPTQALILPNHVLRPGSLSLNNFDCDRNAIYWFLRKQTYYYKHAVCLHAGVITDDTVIMVKYRWRSLPVKYRT